jgi:uncharacterized SAM-binding protein YcdF (DUF218 family)
VFLFKKIISSFLLPPGCFIVLLIGAGIWFISRRRRSCGIFAIAMGMLLWGMSLAPVSNYLMKGLERGIAIPARIHGDVIVLLGGGASDGVRDLSGTGAPCDEMMSRLVTAVRVHRRTGLPVIVSGGAIGKTDTPEAWIVQRVLQDLGVPPRKILVEDQSRDTGENARYVAEVCARNGFRNPLLVTSAYHMKRSLLIFQRNRLEVTPLPASFRYDAHDEITPYTFLPSIANLSGTATALREHLGLLFYRLTLPDSGPGR